MSLFADKTRTERRNAVWLNYVNLKMEIRKVWHGLERFALYLLQVIYWSNDKCNHYKHIHLIFIHVYFRIFPLGFSDFSLKTTQNHLSLLDAEFIFKLVTHAFVHTLTHSHIHRYVYNNNKSNGTNFTFSHVVIW